MKPMLACEYDPSKLKFPCLASAKLDGIRGLIVDGKVLSRSLKMIPSRHVQSLLSHPDLNGLDGELIVGDPTAKDCYNKTTSHVMAQDKLFPFTFHVFDLHDQDTPYNVRAAELHRRVGRRFEGLVEIHPQFSIANEDELLEFEQQQLELGYEGLILRDPVGRYKYGRSTVNEGLLLKVKRFTDSEAVICGFEEQMRNDNEKVTNELGRSKRSSHQENMVGKDTLGALIVRDVHTGVDFNIGTGMDDAIRAKIWSEKMNYVGKIVKYKSFEIGAKDKPRFPVLLGFRSTLDMGV